MRELIFRLARPMMRSLGRDERGAMGVLIAVLIGGGVLLGMGALAIDVGQIYQNRAELQNGADAGALAVADSCALGSCTTGIASQYATGNASKLTGNNAAVDLVCGSGTGMSACPASTGTMVDCPANPPAGTNYVDVHTSTLTASGSTLLPPVFARTLTGNSGYQGTNVKACAQAEWGAPTSAQTIAFTISACSWYVYTNNGTSFAPPPPYPPNPLPTSSFDHILFEHGQLGGQTTGCPPYQPSGQDAPGNFGWTSDPSGNCMTLIANGSYTGNTGTSVPGGQTLGDCETVLANDQANKTLVYLPVYSAISGTGSNVTYTLLGFGAFVITGYHITGSFQAKDWLTNKFPCTGNNFCISGYFTQGLIPSTGSLGGGNGLGASIVKLTG
jgi:Flp pilus assembly protein TadG